MTIELTDDEYMQLLIMMGYATGAAMKQDRKLADNFLRLANAVNKNNPRWTRYEVPEVPAKGEV